VTVDGCLRLPAVNIFEDFWPWKWKACRRENNLDAVETAKETGFENYKGAYVHGILSGYYNEEAHSCGHMVIFSF
jgi:hypothetical protein